MTEILGWRLSAVAGSSSPRLASARSHVESSSLPRVAGATVDWRVLVFTAGIALVTTVLFSSPRRALRAPT